MDTPQLAADIHFSIPLKTNGKLIYSHIGLTQLMSPVFIIVMNPIINKAKTVHESFLYLKSLSNACFIVSLNELIINPQTVKALKIHISELISKITLCAHLQ